MTNLKVLGVEDITRKRVGWAIFTLTLFSFAVNGLYDLYKLIPTMFKAGPLTVDWWSLALFLTPAIVFMLLLIFGYFPYLRQLNQPQFPGEVEPEVEPHKGIILSLSTPKGTVEQINELINKNDASAIEELYKIWGIGQLFKALYHHEKTLKCVWLFTTDKSLQYGVCIKTFLEKFIPRARICCDLSEEGQCHLKQEDGVPLIKEIKDKLQSIYFDDNLREHRLTKSDIIVDISGGTKIITAGMILGAIDSAIEIQYVEQSAEHRVTKVPITPEIILDKVAEYLFELYKKLNEKDPYEAM